MNEEEGEMLEGKKRGEEKVPWRAKLEISTRRQERPNTRPRDENEIEVARHMTETNGRTDGQVNAGSTTSETR